jgi:hypothetical protein
MKTTVNIDKATFADVAQTAKLIREKPATALRLAVREGLPIIAKKYRAPGALDWTLKKDCKCDADPRPGFPVPTCSKCDKPWNLVQD